MSPLTVDITTIVLAGAAPIIAYFALVRRAEIG